MKRVILCMCVCLCVRVCVAAAKEHHKFSQKFQHAFSSILSFFEMLFSLSFAHKGELVLILVTESAVTLLSLVLQLSAIQLDLALTSVSTVLPPSPTPKCAKELDFNIEYNMFTNSLKRATDPYFIGFAVVCSVAIPTLYSFSFSTSTFCE